MNSSGSMKILANVSGVGFFRICKYLMCFAWYAHVLVSGAPQSQFKALPSVACVKELGTVAGCNLDAIHTDLAEKELFISRALHATHKSNNIALASLSVFVQSPSSGVDVFLATIPIQTVYESRPSYGELLENVYKLDASAADSEMKLKTIELAVAPQRKVNRLELECKDTKYTFEEDLVDVWSLVAYLEKTYAGTQFQNGVTEITRPLTNKDQKVGEGTLKEICQKLLADTRKLEGFVKKTTFPDLSSFTNDEFDLRVIEEIRKAVNPVQAGKVKVNKPEKYFGTFFINAQEDLGRIRNSINALEKYYTESLKPLHSKFAHSEQRLLLHLLNRESPQSRALANSIETEQQKLNGQKVRLVLHIHTTNNCCTLCRAAIVSRFSDLEKSLRKMFMSEGRASTVDMQIVVSFRLHYYNRKGLCDEGWSFFDIENHKRLLALESHTKIYFTQSVLGTKEELEKSYERLKDSGLPDDQKDAVAREKEQLEKYLEGLRADFIRQGPY